MGVPVPTVTKVCVDVHGSGCLGVPCQWAGLSFGAQLGFMSRAAAEARVSVRPRVLLRTMSGSVVLPQLRSMLLPAVPSKGHMKPGVRAASGGLVGVERPCCCQSHTDLSAQSYHLKQGC